MFKLVSRAILYVGWGLRRILMLLLASSFKKHGKNVVFAPIQVGDGVFIGRGACLMASESAILRGNKILLRPHVTIMGGDHNTKEIGVYMYD